MIDSLFRIVLGIILALWAICVGIAFFGMLGAMLYLAIRGFWRHGFKAFRVNYKGNTFEDIG
jgi:hypothetical protein